MSRPYRPSSGTEGAAFFEAWCCHCARDKAMREGANYDDCDDNEVCPIIAKTFAHEVTDPEYPKEWIVGDDDYPRCTAYVEAGREVPPPRCERTADMFGPMPVRSKP